MPVVSAYFLVTQLALGLPPGFQAQEIGSSGAWDRITACAFAPDGRIFVAEKRGVVHVIEDNVRRPEPFLDLEHEVLSDGDRGLLGLALSPDFEVRPLVYVLYSVDPDGDGIDDDGPAFGRLARFAADPAQRNRADLASRTVLLGASWTTGIPALSTTHTVGCLRFALDGTLFVSTGDGARPDLADAGGENPDGFGPGKLDPAEDIGSFRSQWLGSLAGKILRIDPETGLGLPSNPFWTGSGADNPSRVWVYGLRNPFRFAVDPDSPPPGRLAISDVGWRTWEEIDIAEAGGENFGWPCVEGPSPPDEYPSTSPAHHGCGSLGTPENPSLPRAPLILRHHANAALSLPAGRIGKAATGIAFYSGTRYPEEYRGALFHSDFAEGWIDLLHSDETPIHVHEFTSTIDGPVDIVPDPASGDLHVISLARNQIRRIVYDLDNRPPEAAAVADPVQGTVPLEVRFASIGTSDPDGDPVSHAWSFGDGAVSPLPDPVHVYESPGIYTAVLTVDDGRGGQGSKSIEIDVEPASGGNSPPSARIQSPLDGDSYVALEELVLRATAEDAEDPVEDLEFSWTLDLHHNTHVHPAWLGFRGPTARFVPGEHDDGTGVWFEISLRVRDRGNLSTVARVRIYPDPNPIVVDNGAPGTSFTGYWPISGGGSPHGVDSRYSKTAGNVYTWRAGLSPGAYKVYAWWTAFASRPIAVPYDIVHAYGIDRVFVDQTGGADRWNLLGIYTFGLEGQVDVIAVGGNKSTCADAVRFVSASAAGSPPGAHIESIEPNPSVLGQEVRFSGHAEGTVTGYEWRSSIDGVLSNAASFATSALSAGDHEIAFIVKDGEGLPAAQAAAPLTVTAQATESIVDNRDPGVSSTGTWSVSGGGPPHGADSVYAKSAGASFRFPARVPRGLYQVSAWWTAWPSRSAAAPYTIEHAAGSTPVLVDQRSGGGVWRVLGTFTLTENSSVTLRGVGSSATVLADAVRFVRLGAGSPPSLDLVLDAGEAGTNSSARTNSSGAWSPSGAPDPWGSGSLYAKGLGTYRYTFPIEEAGTWEVLAWWTAWPSRSASVEYVIAHDGGTTTRSANQLVDGGRWNSLGVFAFASEAWIEIRARADGKTYSADAIRLRKVVP